jgi:AsmA protein
MKILKVLFYGLGGLALLAVLGLAAVVLVVDGVFVKGRLERMMKEEKQRTLKIEGEPRLSLFPKLALSLGRTTLSEPASEKEFLSLESMSVSVGLMPLLSREVAVDAFSIVGLKVNVVRARDGSLNVADLAAPLLDRPEAAHAEEQAPPKVRIAEVRIERAQLAYRDESTGQELRVNDLNLKTGRLEDDTPSDISFAAHVTGKRPDSDLRAQLTGTANLNLAKRTFALAKLDGKVSGSAAAVRGLDARITGSLAGNPGRGEFMASEFNVAAKGVYEKDAFSVALAAPQLAITPGKAGGAAVTADLKVKGPSRNVDARFRLEGVEGTAEALTIAALALDIDAAVAPHAFKGRISTPVKGNLKARSWELPKIVANLTITSPSIPQRSVTLPIEASAQANLAKQTAAMELSTRFDESTIRAKLGATRLEPLVATFGLNVDRLNMDRYLPPAKKQSNPNEPLDLSALKGPTASGKAEIGTLTIRRVKLANVKAEIKLAGGKLEVAPHSAVLYGGTLAGSLSADANGNRITAKESVQGVQVGPLLRDAAEQDRLEGRGNVTLDVAMAGASVAALKRSMGGSARVELRDGAVKGINLGEAIQDVRSVLGSKSAKANDPSKRTDFSEITASFAIRNGVAHNEDLQGKAPLFRLGGAGDVDIGNSTVNYTAKAALVATSKGQGGRDLSNLAGVTVPVRVTGSLEKPDIAVDFGELLAKSGAGIGRALGSAGSTAGGAAGSVGQKLKGIFGR